MTRDKTWIQTWTGKQFWPMQAKGQIEIADIARALSMLCRFAGHVRTFYSVAEHSVAVMRRVADTTGLLRGVAPNRNALLAALLHDATEAYLVDVPKPVKDQDAFTEYRTAEKRLQDRIFKWAGVDRGDPGLFHVWEADSILCSVEARDLKAPLHKEWGLVPVAGLDVERYRPQGLPPAEAERLFLSHWSMFHA